MVALLLGLAIRNAIGLPVIYEGGLKFCLRHVLRFGIMLLGLRLSLAAVGDIGLVALPVIVGCITTAPVLVTWINLLRWSAPAPGQPHRRGDKHLRRQRVIVGPGRWSMPRTTRSVTPWPASRCSD